MKFCIMQQRRNYSDIKIILKMSKIVQPLMNKLRIISQIDSDTGQRFLDA